ncbi:WD40/YVTN/BNR-like repeat-containing protein [Paenibacillus xylanilyticus]|uniref:WD40/YVTN/BNR-like repeat-containing protein n=1 Tax=Paenibacillus xylanilyticus TaxID=248903 RepID=UPI0039A36005
MRRKSTFLWVVCLSLSLLFLVHPVGSVDANAEDKTIDSITLKEMPISIGEGWTVDKSYSSNAPYALTKGKNEYIAVGAYGSVIKSKDGITWKALSKFGGYHLTAIDWDGSKYVMFGSNTEYSFTLYKKPSEGFISTDGLTWTKINFNPGETIHQLVWGNGGFVALGEKHIFTSVDGENWTTSRSLYNEYGANSLKYVNGTYFITSIYDDKFVLISKDGQNWSAKKYNESAAIRDIAWTGKQYIGVGNGIYTSADGFTWKKQSKSPSGAELSTIVYGHNKYIVTGATNQKSGINKNIAYTSKDGVNWKKTDLSYLYTNIYIIYPVANGFAGIGSNDRQDAPDSTYSIYTKDGTAWSYRIVGSHTGGELSGLATNGKRTVAVGMNGTVIYTDNGTTWRSSNPFAYREKLGRPNLYDVVWGANKFVAAGHNGIYYSGDGYTWKKASVPFKDEYGQLRKILWTGKFFVASDQTYGTYTSKDGLKWTRIPNVSDNWLTSMIWDGNRLLATFRVHNFNTGVGTTKLMQTTDGVHWKFVKTIDLDQAHLAWNGSSYVAADQSNSLKTWVSKDGLNWTKKKTTFTKGDFTGFDFLTSFDGNFFAMATSYGENNGSNTYYLSKDGVQWKETAVPSKNQGLSSVGIQRMQDGIKMYGKFIFVGGYGEIMYARKL